MAEGWQIVRDFVTRLGYSQETLDLVRRLPSLSPLPYMSLLLIGALLWLVLRHLVKATFGMHARFSGAGVLQALVSLVMAPRRFPKFGAGPREVAGARFGVPGMGRGLHGLSGRTYRTERRAMVQRVWQLVHHDGFGFMKAPPFSGKTAFMQQVLNHAEAQGWRAFYFNCSVLKELGLKLDEALRRACGGTLAELMTEAARGDDDCKLVLAVDEAQLLYNVQGSGSQQFFTALKKLEPTVCNVRVLFAAAYGAGASSDSQMGGPSIATPGDLDTSRSISIHPGRVSLRLDPEDIDELWGAWKVESGLQLEDAVKDQIVAMCASQVGLMVACLDFLSDNIVNISGASLQNRKAVSLLASAAFYHTLEGVRSLRHLPKDDMLSVLRQLLWKDAMLASGLGDAFVRKLASYGQAYVDPSGMLQLTSPLHKAILMRHLYMPGSRFGVLRPDVGMLMLLSRIVERMDPRLLSLTLSLGSDQRILERCWQMEVYRACSSVLCPEAALSPDVGQALGGKGYMDFYISEPYCVGLELTREGCKITEHLGRFLDPEKYGPMLESGALKQHAVVDFRAPPRSGTKAGVRKTDPHLYTVQFEEGFTQATIWNQGAGSVVHVCGVASNRFWSIISAEAAVAAAFGGP